MARVTPTTEPTVLIAGDSWSWTKTLSTYPPSEGWGLGYSFRGASTLLDTDVVTAVSGGGYAVSVDKTKTAALVAGAYRWQSYVTGSGTYAGLRYTVEEGILTVEAGLSALTGSQGQQHVERTLAKIEAEIEARLAGNGSAHESYSIMGRSIGKIPMEKLLRMRAIYGEKVRRLNNPGNISTPVLAQMNPPDGMIGQGEPIVLPWWFRGLTG